MTLDVFKQFLEDKEAPDMFISGVAGTGKTTSLGELLKYCIDNKITTVTCAYTHKAVNVLAKKVPFTDLNVVCTLHSFLKKRPTINSEATKVKEVEGNAQVDIPKEVHVVFIDEFSMVGERDYVDLVDLQYDEDANIATKIVWIGDPNQLPPVKDMQTIFPKGDYCVQLTKVYRQAGDNQLIDTLMSLNDFINDGEPARLEPHDTFIRNTNIVDKYRACNTGKVLLAYTNARVEELNAEIQGYEQPLVGDALFSPTVRTLYSLEAIDKFEDVEYVIKVNGDLLMRDEDKYKTFETLKDLPKVQFFLLNDSEMRVSQRAIVFGHATYLDMNQELIDKAVKANKAIEKQYPGVNLRDWSKANWSDPLAKERAKAWREYLTYKQCVICIDFTHAMTVHKSQGSTYENVFLDMDDIGKCANSDYQLYLKLLYVAISRASDTVYTN